MRLLTYSGLAASLCLFIIFLYLNISLPNVYYR